MNKLLGSSINQDKLSLTIKGIIVAVFGLAATIGMGVGIPEGNELAASVENIIKNIVGLVSSAMVAYGLIRKIWVAISKKKESETE